MTAHDLDKQVQKTGYHFRVCYSTLEKRGLSSHVSYFPIRYRISIELLTYSSAQVEKVLTADPGNHQVSPEVLIHRLFEHLEVLLGA